MISRPSLQPGATSHSSNVRAMFSSSPVIKVHNKAYIVYLFLCFAMMSFAGAFPNRQPTVLAEKNRTVVIFHNQPCKKVDHKHLSKRMGELFDNSRMALDEATVKRSIAEDGSEDEDDKTIIHPYSEDPEKPTYHKSVGFMRRKRDVEEEEEDIDGVNNFKSQYQRLMESKAMKKQFKRFIRKSKKLKKVKKLPWTCKMKKVWLQMEDGYFPPFIRSAECRSKKCFFNLNDCIPKKYVISILRRDPNRCNPVPSYGLKTTYEEVWFLDRYHVTVWCDCGIASGKRRRGKKKNKNGRSRP